MHEQHAMLRLKMSPISLKNGLLPLKRLQNINIRNKKKNNWATKDTHTHTQIVNDLTIE